MNWLGDCEITWQPGLAIGKYSRVIVTSNDRMIAVDQMVIHCYSILMMQLSPTMTQCWPEH